ncbi:restriction endonuclease, partial [Salmonella enterica subsp. enterica serovar Mbandaka]
PLATLKSVRPDLSIPEVRDGAEWRLFLKMTRRGIPWESPDDVWYPVFAREVDMTRERRHFRDSGGPSLLPLVEGRMVHQHRFGAKEYIDATGRRAIWRPTPPGRSGVHPQFWIPVDRVPSSTRARAGIDRVGFCDIAGQTNERSMLASFIPAGVICGNKV